MKHFFIRGLFFLLLSTFCLTLQAEILSLSSAINIAGRQRMLSQRILKAYSMIGISVDVLRVKKSMSQDIDLFDNQLAELISFAPNKEVKATLSKVGRLWKPYVSLVETDVSIDKALELLTMSEELLLASHKVVLQLEDLSPTQHAHLVNVAGRQRMLSQRMSMLYMLRTWGFDNAQIRNQLMQDKNEFDGALSELNQTSLNTVELKKWLKTGQSEWRLFKYGLDGVKQKPTPYIVHLAGNKLLKTMDKTTELYANLHFGE